MAWLSPSYPIGAFSYSSGIEWAVETGDIHDTATLRDWIAAMLEEGSVFCDAVLFAEEIQSLGSLFRQADDTFGVADHGANSRATASVFEGK